MKVGMASIGLGPFSDPDTMAHVARTAERCGFESLWAPDHSAIPDGHQTKCPYTPDGEIPGGPDAPLVEPINAMSFVAGLTSKIKLGTGIMILPQRHPFYVAKEVATLDLISKGRALLGIGSGWCAEEFTALGLDFHQRGKRTDEAMQALRALWREDPSTFKGTHFNFERIRSFPKPVQKGGVPLLVGGHSRAAARRAARYGDGFYPLTPIVDADVSKIDFLKEIKDLIGLLHEECAKAGRKTDGFDITTGSGPDLDMIRRLEDIGVTRVFMSSPTADRDGISRSLEKIGNEVIARL
ncbi:MAG TPA: LLM class F420-dependent oxidoreductase [Candidatus Binataceae bacterium]|jgi:probable F420-dependent oxidoreductase|nr:LLM class F420-dependent oxidoreductase [Candidatus Binataceae bacterium]